MEKDYYFISYTARDVGRGEWTFHNALLDNQHPLEWQVELNKTYKGTLWRLLSWQRISEKEYKTHFPHIG